MFAREMRGRGGGMDEVEQDKPPLVSQFHRPERACTRGVLQPFSKWKQDENNSQSLICDMKKLVTVPEKPAIIDNIRWINEQRTEGDVELSGSVLKGLSAKCGSGKKQGVSDENRRKTHKLSQLSTSYDEFPILNTFDQERKLLVLIQRRGGKGDNGLLVRPKAVQVELKEERVKIGKRDPLPD